MNNLKENIKKTTESIKKIILSKYKNHEMFVVMFKEYAEHNQEKFFMSQAFNVGKMNCKNLSIVPKYENGFVRCDILMQGIYKMGEVFFKYNEKNDADFIDKFHFNLTHHMFNYINGEFRTITRICHGFNYKSRMRMVELNVNEEQVEEYLNLCKVKNWDCKLIEKK